VITMNYSSLFIGIFIGILVELYLFPLLDGLMQVINYKLSEIATTYNLNAQEKAALFYKKYPELNPNQNKELSPAIGFTCVSPNEDILYYDDDEECKNKF